MEGAKNTPKGVGGTLDLGGGDNFRQKWGTIQVVVVIVVALVVIVVIIVIIEMLIDM